MHLSSSCGNTSVQWHVRHRYALGKKSHAVEASITRVVEVNSKRHTESEQAMGKSLMYLPATSVSASSGHGRNQSIVHLRFKDTSADALQGIHDTTQPLKRRSECISVAVATPSWSEVPAALTNSTSSCLLYMCRNNPLHRSAANGGCMQKIYFRQHTVVLPHC